MGPHGFAAPAPEAARGPALHRPPAFPTPDRRTSTRPAGARREAAAAQAGGTAPEPSPTGAWLAAWMPAVDLVVALGVLFACVALAEGIDLPRDAAHFLALRVSVRNALLVSALLTWASAALRITGAYDAARSPTLRDLVANTLAGCTMGAAPAAALPWITGSGRLSAALGLFIWCGLVVGAAAARLAARATVRVRRGPPVHVVIAGTGPRARALWDELRQDPAVRYRLVAVTDTPGAIRGAPLGGAPGVAVGQLAAFMMRTVVDEVFVALPVRSCYDEIETVLRVCETAGVHSRFLADPIATRVARQRAAPPSGAFPAVEMHVVVDDWRLVVKRALDVLGAALGLLALSPLLLAVALAVRVWGGPGSVFFAQERYGMRKRRFRMYKFRTMVSNAEALLPLIEAQNEATGAAFKMRRDPRVTAIGRVLRRTSIDELPQLWNVLTGDMSLVGPRPMSVRDVSRFDETWLMRRFSVRPGLTCLWQVGGRSDVTFERWMELDLNYIDAWSLSLDVRILAATVPAVLRGAGAA